MTNQEKEININEEDAFYFIIKCLNEGGFSNYGYDLYLSDIMEHYLISILEVESRGARRHLNMISPHFYSAAWELCRRGILRPGVRQWGLQHTEDGSAGNGYSITPFGEKWLQESTHYDYVPIDPGRFAKMLAGFADVFGPGFLERSQEAIRCYGSHAYLGCCAMCGAAAESIILHLAITKTGDEEKVLKDYVAAGGRGRTENKIIGQGTTGIQNEFRGYTSLLKYWRDVASHGKKTDISDNEAYTSLALLLRFAQFSKEKLTDLTQG